MSSFVRSLLVVVAGALAAGVAVAAVEAGSLLAFPLPPGVEVGQPGFVEHVPLGGKIGVLIAWILGPVVGGYIAARWAPRAPLVHALAIGALFTLADAFNLMQYPSPQWMVAVGLAAPLPAAWLGAQIALRPKAEAA